LTSVLFNHLDHFNILLKMPHEIMQKFEF
jgi:hypothetical protein